MKFIQSSKKFMGTLLLRFQQFVVYEASTHCGKTFIYLLLLCWQISSFGTALLTLIHTMNCSIAGAERDSFNYWLSGTPLVTEMLQANQCTFLNILLSFLLLVFTSSCCCTDDSTSRYQCSALWFNYDFFFNQKNVSILNTRMERNLKSINFPSWVVPHGTVPYLDMRILHGKIIDSN
jgi:hypothetical protein